MTPDEAIHLAGVASLVMLGLGMLLSLARLLRGPRLPDRVVALDLIGALAIGGVTATAVVTDQPVLLRPAVVLALVGFVGTVAFAMYLEKRERT